MRHWWLWIWTDSGGFNACLSCWLVQLPAAARAHARRLGYEMRWFEVEELEG